MMCVSQRPLPPGMSCRRDHQSREPALQVTIQHQVPPTCPSPLVSPNLNLPRRSEMPLSQGPPSEGPPSEDAYAADQEDTDEDEEDTDDEMWNWDPRPNVTSQLSGGRAADPLLPDDVQRATRGRGSYESVGGEVEQRERERRRHEMRSRSPTNISTRLVQSRKAFGNGWELTICGGQN